MKTFKERFLCLNRKNITLILIYISLSFCLISLKKQILKQNINKIRSLNDDNDNDLRSKGANENCIGFVDNNLYAIFELKGPVKLEENYNLSLCENIGNYKSSFILKNDTKIIRLAGDINGEKNNKNKIVINDTSIKIYLAGGDICNGKERYKVELSMEGIPDITHKDDYYYDYGHYFYYNNYANNYIYRTGECQYLVKIYEKAANIYLDYYGINLSLPLQIIIGLIVIGFGIVIKICNFLSKDIACYLIFIIGSFFPQCAIYDLTKYDILALLLVGFFGTIFIFSLMVYCAIYPEGEGVKRDSKKYRIILGVFCGYPMIKMISTFTIVFIKTTHQRLIHNIVLLAFSICGGILGGQFPEIFCLIGSNIFENYLIIKGLSFIFYSLATPIDEQKIYDLAKTQNFEKIYEMINCLGLIYPLIFWGLLIIIPLLKHIYNLLETHRNNKKKKKEDETPTGTPKEKEEKCIEVPYYETQN